MEKTEKREAVRVREKEGTKNGKGLHEGKGGPT